MKTVCSFECVPRTAYPNTRPPQSGSGRSNWTSAVDATPKYWFTFPLIAWFGL